MRDAGLPVPVVNLRVRAAGRWFELDQAWPLVWVDIEVDGAGSHTTAFDVRADERRDEMLGGAGWRVERVPASLLQRPEEYVRLVRRILREAGHPDLT